MSDEQFLVFCAIWFVLGAMPGFLIGRESVRREQKRARPLPGGRDGGRG